MAKPTILVFVGCYIPGFKSGGPIRTISNLVNRLGDELNFRIVTKDRDYLEEQPYPNVPIDTWVRVGKANVFYLSPQRCSLRNISRLIGNTDHNVLYLNSFFNPKFTIFPLLARKLTMSPLRPTVIAPRGEFTGQSWMIKRWKKRPFVAIAKRIGLYRDLTWQASSEDEAADIRKVMGATAHSIIVVPNLPGSSELQRVSAVGVSETRTRGFRVCSVARITPEKNLAFALSALSRVRHPLDFNIYGLISDHTYWDQCRKRIEKLPNHIAVQYHGPLAHEDVVQTIAGHDLLFFPTLGENYGHIIIEALSAGVPVLISDQTPWKDLEDCGVGWSLPLDNTARFSEVLESQAKLDNSARSAQRKSAARYAERVVRDQEVVAKNLDLFRKLAVR